MTQETTQEKKCEHIFVSTKYVACKQILFVIQTQSKLIFIFIIKNLHNSKKYTNFAAAINEIIIFLFFFIC
jgi:hypothetical protein